MSTSVFVSTVILLTLGERKFASSTIVISFLSINFNEESPEEHTRFHGALSGLEPSWKGTLAGV